MKALSIILLFLLFGCAPSTPNLIGQAQLTGDWSLVYKRFDAIDKWEAQREAQRGPSCPRDMKPVCVKRGRKQSCSCLSNSGFRDRLDSLLGRLAGV